MTQLKPITRTVKYLMILRISIQPCSISSGKATKQYDDGTFPIISCPMENSMDEVEQNTTAPVQQEIYPSSVNKDELPDYLPGPVRIYSSEEIAEYMKTRRP